MQHPISKPVRARWAGVIATAAAVTASWFLLPGIGSALDGALYDRVQRAQHRAAGGPLTVVAIDGPSTARIGPWPWPEAVLTRLVDTLAAHGARVIAFATPLPEFPGTRADDAIDRPAAERFAGRSTLASAMFAHGGVIVAVDPSADPLSSQDEREGIGARGWPAGVLPGHVRFEHDQDGIARRMPAEISWYGTAIPALPLAIVGRATDRYGARLEQTSRNRLRIGARTVPVDRGALRPQFRVDGTERAYAEWPAWQVLDSGYAPGPEFADSIVVIGHAGERIATPVSHSQSVAHVVAAAVQSVLADRAIAHPSWARLLEWLAAVLAVAFVGSIVPLLGPWRSLAATSIFAGTFVAIELATLAWLDLWLALAVPAFAVLVGWGVARAAFLDVTRAPATHPPGDALDQNDSMRLLAQTFRTQGRLELAFETLRQCPADPDTLGDLYAVGLEFERNEQRSRAARVFAYIAGIDPAFRDASARVVLEQAGETHDFEWQPAIDDPVHGPLSIALPETPAAEAPDLDRLGRYEIERQLGKGAMGVVYLGRDPRINRVVAIKAIALADEFEDADLAEAKARFFREAEMAGRLNHPGIVTIYDVGEDGRLAFIAMELLRGLHLSHYAEPPNLLPTEQVLEIVARVAEALHYAHEQNVVHRDIKPANIMFNPDTDELKITDFGIARLTDASRTKTGIVLGTPSFMSPEQLEGRRLDGRSDLFALGVSLYQLLTGQLPFRAESMTRLMHKIATEAHSPIRSIRPELPESVEAVIARALAKGPDDRFQTGAELAAALRDCAARVAA